MALMGASTSPTSASCAIRGAMEARWRTGARRENENSGKGRCVSAATRPPMHACMHSRGVRRARCGARGAAWEEVTAAHAAARAWRGGGGSARAQHGGKENEREATDSPCTQPGAPRPRGAPAPPGARKTAPPRGARTASGTAPVAAAAAAAQSRQGASVSGRASCAFCFQLAKSRSDAPAGTSGRTPFLLAGCVCWERRRRVGCRAARAHRIATSEAGRAKLARVLSFGIRSRANAREDIPLRIP
jgi:hypothetical protein